MARRSTARRGGAREDGTAAAADAGYDDYGGYGGYDDYGADPDRPATRFRTRRPRSGSGGRWWIWVGRAVLWAFILVVLFNGIWMPLRGGTAAPSDPPDSGSEEPAFPDTAAAAFAARFADAYLNTADGDGRERADVLAEFVPEGRAAAFTVGGALTGENIEAVAIDVQDDHNAVVTLAADVNGEPMSLDVPVYAADSSSLVVSGTPALLAAPAKAELPDSASDETDSDARDELEPILEGFFEAYAETPDHLTRYLEDGAQITELPEGTLRFAELRDVTVPVRASEGDDVRQATATVVWRRACGDDEGTPADLTQSYRLTVVKDNGNWYVRDIHGAPQSFGE
mgnify:CR=1 FL=1